ncbi:MAG: YsnF/AvaK domain-containing protein [Bryobacteraceae bacterium]
MDYPTDETTHESQSQDTQDVSSVSQSNNIEELVVPVLKEELEVHKELRKTGTVRVRRTVHELEEVVSESLASETVDVQRIPMDLIVDSPPQVRTEGDVMIIPVVREEVVVTKQLRVVEELRVTKRKSVSDYRENVTVRAEEVVIERIDSENSKTETSEVQG